MIALLPWKKGYFQKLLQEIKMYPKLIYCMLTKKPKYKTYAEVYLKKLKETLNYHLTHGKDAFGSERSYADRIYTKAMESADRAWSEDQTCGADLSRILVESKREEDKMRKKYEAMKTFIKWVP